MVPSFFLRQTPVPLQSSTRVANPPSRRILAGEFKEGETALVDYVDGEYVFGKKEAARKREKAAARAG